MKNESIQGPMQDPQALLERAARLETATQKAASNDKAVLVFWAIWIAVMIPPFDFVDSNVWGPVALVAGIVGGFGTSDYYRRRTSQVHALHALTPWFWVGWGAFYFVVVALTEVGSRYTAYAHSIGAVISIIPLAVVALRIRGNRALADNVS